MPTKELQREALLQTIANMKARASTDFSLIESWESQEDYTSVTLDIKFKELSEEV